MKKILLLGVLFFINIFFLSSYCEAANWKKINYELPNADIFVDIDSIKKDDDSDFYNASLSFVYFEPKNEFMNAASCFMKVTLSSFVMEITEVKYLDSNDRVVGRGDNFPAFVLIIPNTLQEAIAKSVKKTSGEVEQSILGEK